MIPIIALVRGGEQGVDIGIGAILGAPLMLSTLAMFVTGFSVVIFSRRRQNGMNVKANPEVMRRDLGFFLIVFAAALLTGTSASCFKEMATYHSRVHGLFLLFLCVYHIEG